MRIAGGVLAGVALCAFAGGPSRAAWQAAVITPPGHSSARAWGVCGDNIVAYDTRALLYSISSGSWTSLHPTGALSSMVLDTSETQQVGSVQFESGQHAAVWAGNAASFIDLHPPGWAASIAMSVAQGEQTGYVWANESSASWRASLWHGSPATWTELHPAGYQYSEAVDTDGVRQVGWASGPATGGNPHAAVWNGRASSFVDIHPSGHTESRATCVSGSTIGGYTSVPETIFMNRAGLWQGLTAIWTSLHPAGYAASRVDAACGDVQVGSASGTDFSHAGVWKGSARSWLDLHYLVPPGYTNSSATDVYASGDDLWVVGSASGPQNPRVIVLWHYTSAPPPQDPTSVGLAKLAPAGSFVYVTDAVVTAADLLDDSVFVQAEDRSSGIRLKTIEKPANGSRVSFSGHISVEDGEQFVRCETFHTVTPGPPARPLFMASRDIGNDPTESLAYQGLCTVGLLARIEGRVTAISSAQRLFWIDDGCHYQEGVVPVRGLRVRAPSGVTLPPTNRLALVTGVSRVERITLTGWAEVNGDWYPPGSVVYVPSVWMRDAADLSLQ